MKEDDDKFLLRNESFSGSKSSKDGSENYLKIKIRRIILKSEDKEIYKRKRKPRGGHASQKNYRGAQGAGSKVGLDSTLM